MSRYFQQDIMGEHVSFGMNEYRQIIILGQHHESTDKRCDLCKQSRAQEAQSLRLWRSQRNRYTSALSSDRERFYTE